MSESPTYSQWRPHPWHGLAVGPRPPEVVHAYVEITPFDLMKYEIDKFSGYMVIDRPQRTSSQPPALYGFIPRTYCAGRVGRLMEGTEQGDEDPLDICVFTERPISRAEILIEARVIGGVPMIDGGAADDKIVAVLENDPLFAAAHEIEDLPPVIVERLTHYFMTYKLRPNTEVSVSVGPPYGRAHAWKVIEASMEDYRAAFGPERRS